MNLTAYFAFLLVLLSKLIDCSGLPRDLEDDIVAIRNKNALPGTSVDVQVPFIENDQEFALFLNTMNLEGMKEVTDKFDKARNDKKINNTTFG